MVHFIGSQDSTRDGVSIKSSSMLMTTEARHEFLRAEGEFKEEAGKFDYRDSVSDQKRIGPHVYEPVSSWSDEVAQTQQMKSLANQHMPANIPVELPGTHRENEEHLQARQASSEIVAQFVSMSQSLDNILIVQHEDKLASIRSCMGSGFDGHPSTVGSLAPMGRRLPLVPTSKPEHVLES